MTSSDKSSSLGTIVRERRLALGYSLGQLANQVNRTAALIRGWEKGSAHPAEDEATALAEALDLDAAMLIELIPPPGPWQGDDAAGGATVDDPWHGTGQPADGEAATAPEPKPGDEFAVGTDESSDSQQATDPDDKAAPSGPVEEADSAGGGGAILSEQEEPTVVDFGVAATGEAHDDLDEVGDDAEQSGGASPASAEAPTIDDNDVTDEPRAGAGSAGSELADMYEAPTEAVPIVPTSAVALAESSVPVDAEFASAAAEPITTSSNPLIAAWDRVLDVWYTFFDPRRKWIYRVRFVLILIAFYIMLKVLGWAVGNLWDGLNELLDSFSFSPAETPDVAN